MSKITICSKSAICSQNKEKKELKINYKDNVVVTLADNTTIKSNVLEILLESSSLSTIKPDLNSAADSSQIKKVAFNGSVAVQQQNRKLFADSANIYPQQKQCKLSGNVKIQQTKKLDTDIPLTTRANVATLDLNTNELVLLGNQNTPVSTVINIDNHPLVKKLSTRK
ncbi:LPS export ABC transporter periplasmic protein LptC [Candidatus Babeliales bacterium]|nr:LPS export ABC transporter periplasmic protein LptC [Candidatus Babeliales bacterium]